MDRRMADALRGLPQAKKIFAAAVKAHEAIPREVRRGVFSPRYLDLKVEQGIDVDEAAGIVQHLVDLIGADDQINSSLTLALTQADADARTAAVNPSLFAPLHFNGGDDDGIYDAYLKLRRA
jgi:hypothetical protein